MPIEAPLTNRYVFALDVERYSKRNTRRQVDIQDALTVLTGQAGRACGLDPDGWATQDTGDGFIVVPPADTDAVRLVGRLAGELDRVLAVYNMDRVPETHIRLRLAIHNDTVLPRGDWFTGAALIEVCRLLDSPPVRTALTRAAPAHLALIVSETVYKGVVETTIDGLDPEDFTEVVAAIEGKDYEKKAYVHVPGKPGRALADAPAEADGAAPPPPGGAAPSVTNSTTVKGDRNQVLSAGGDISGVSG